MLILLQTERAFQKQPTVFLNKKKALLSGKSAKIPRHFRNIGLGFKTPREVWANTCEDLRASGSLV